MANYNIWDKVLSPSEEIKFEFTLGSRYISIARNFWIVLGIPFLFLFGLGIILIIIGFFWAWYLRRTNNFAFTNKRILIFRGWLSTHLVSIDYDKITDVRVEQPLFEKVAFNTGNLIVNTAGSDFPEVVLTYIENPYEVKIKLDQIRERSI